MREGASMLSRTTCGRPGALSVCYKLVELPATSPSPPDRGGDARVLVTVEAKTAAL